MHDASPLPNPPPQAGGADRDGFGVYVHWPFCLSKCPYCDFNSHVRHAPIDEARFASAFAREIETTAQRAPGIYSARWAGPTKDFAAAMAQIERLLQERGATSPEKRKAHFVSALCVAWPDDHLEQVEARVDGTLVWPPRGTSGFGYDPMFLPDGHDRTFGEMTSVEKHGMPPLGLGLSHRARAFVKLVEICLDGR